MNKKDLSVFFRDLLTSEEAQDKLQEIWEDVTQKRKEMIWAQCPRCKALSWKKMEIEVEKYNLRDVSTFLRLMADFGPGKPAEKKEVEIRSTIKHEDMSRLSDDELASYAG